MSRRFRLRKPGLKFLLGGMSASVLAMPFFIAGILTLALSVNAPKAPLFRLEYLSGELGAAIAMDESGALSAKPDFEAPPGLSLVVTDQNGKVILSTVDKFPAGDSVDLETVAAAVRVDPKSLNFFAETLRSQGRTVGRYFAWITPQEQAVAARARGLPIGLLVFAALVAAAFAVGGLFATQLARAVLKLERAAGRIASGDLETAVAGAGNIREIVELAAAMDGMRATLREDRDKRARFLAAVSHDLRTPLTSIGGYLEAVEDGMAGDPETLDRYVRIMRDKTRLLESRISSLIEFARMETGEWRMGFETVELRAFLEGLGRELREDSALLGRDFSFELSALGSFRAPVDKSLLSRAFENLVSNAIRYSPPGGAVRMSARSEGGFLFVDLDDEGPGIAPSEREKVFEAFVRGSGAREGEGSGLGLYIVRSVIRGHGWDVRASSSPSGGGRFSVAIPLPNQVVV
jgi:Signal transduction histidine kinase